MSDVTPDPGTGGEVREAISEANGLRIVRVFDAHREAVFAAWVEPEAFANWFGEPGSTLPMETVSMDVRPGGTWSVIMIAGPERAELPFSGHYREIVEPERLVLTLDNPEDPEGPNVELMTVVLRDLGDGRTEMTFTQAGGNLPEDEYPQALRGWLIFFERQNDYLKARHDSGL